MRWSSNYAFDDTIKTLETDRWAACDMLRDIDNGIDYDTIQKILISSWLGDSSILYYENTTWINENHTLSKG